MNLSQKKYQKRVLGETVIKIRVPQIAGNILIG
jgi:hypothetical protein